MNIHTLYQSRLESRRSVMRLVLLVLILALALGPGNQVEPVRADNLVTISRENTWLLPIVDQSGMPLVYPTRLVVTGNSIYVLDRGSLFHGRLTPEETDQLVVTPLAPDALAPARIEGAIMHELVDVVSCLPGTVDVLDKRGNVFTLRWEAGEPRWQLLRRPDATMGDAFSVPVALACYENKRYLLDSGLGQVYRLTTVDERWVALLASTVDAVMGVGLAIDGDIHILTRTGLIRRYRAGRLVGDRELALASLVANAAAGPALPSIMTSADSSLLFVVHPRGNEIVAVDKTSTLPRLRYQLTKVGPGRPLRSATLANGRLWLLAGSDLYVYPQSGAFHVP